MTPAQWVFLRMCLKVAHPQYRTVSLKGVMRAMGCHFNNVWVHAQRMTELGLMRRIPVGKKCGRSIYALTCSFIPPESLGQ
jgi:hypothetical protein